VHDENVFKKLQAPSCVNRQFLGKRSQLRPRIFVQLGAGAGDQDPRTHGQDGFTHFVKRQRMDTNDVIVVVEANPHNIPALERAWADYPTVQVRQVGVVPDEHSAEALTFWFADEDAPHFQVFSLDRQHVQNHYPESQLRSTEVSCVPIRRFLDEFVEDADFALLAVDVEGIDAEILLAIDWSSFRCQAVSFEFVHLGDKEQRVVQALKNAGLIPAGFGLDTNGYDRLFIRPEGLRDRVKARVWEWARAHQV
jgi:FkbM family methyltransferase